EERRMVELQPASLRLGDEQLAGLLATNSLSRASTFPPLPSTGAGWAGVCRRRLRARLCKTRFRRSQAVGAGGRALRSPASLPGVSTRAIQTNFGPVRFWAREKIESW